MFTNEEEIRGKLLLPFLNDLGFNLSEISLEKSFTIRIGKTQQVIKGRSDILCKRNEKNLFIVELKSDSVTITQNDIDQGISYARALLDNIAPFTIITNGKTTKIFDSISRIELTGKKISEESDFWKNDCTLSTDEELRIRYEALKKFVSFSSENLKLFCQNQVQDRMGTIVGGIDDYTSKFVRDLYVQRKELKTQFNNFINSETKFFGIVGFAGVGKTNEMCSLALQSLENSFTFFYNASIINKSPLEHIAQDLNLVFSSKSDSDVVLKKLDELGRFLNKTILIFIDAIDESTVTNLPLELSEIALACRNLEKVKFCISCKSNIWQNILRNNDTKTHLFEELNKSHGLISSLNNSPGFLLEDFNDEELKDVIHLYKNAFGFKGQMSETLLKELKNGFFLRIFSDVYRNKQIPEKISDKDLIKKYIKQSLEKTNLGFQSGNRILSKIGEILVNHKYGSWASFKDEGLEIESLIRKLNFSIDSNIPEDLFARNLLIKSTNEEDSYNVNFYYSKIRDYIICFHSYQLDKLSEDEFYDILDKFYQNYIGRSAISFYIENASFTHKNTLIKFKKDKALKYVLGYNSYLEDNFKNFKNLFDPKTEGDIGIILLQNLLDEDGYALFPLNSNSRDKIEYQSFGDMFSHSYDDDIFLEKGAKTIHSSNISILASNQNEAVQKEIFKQLRDIVQKGRISTYNSDILLLELVATILYYYYPKLGYDFKIHDFYLPRFDLIYPINLEDLRNRVYKFRASHYYRRRNWDTDKNIVDQLVETAFKDNIDIPALNVTGDFPPFEELFKVVNILLEKGYNIIEKHHLPYPDKPVIDERDYYGGNKDESFSRRRITQYSEEQAKLYIKSFFGHLESCYKEFVEYNFPTFKNKFSFYTTLPHEYIFYMGNSNVLTWGWFGNIPSKCEEVKISYKESTTSEKAFKEDKIPRLRTFSLNSILCNDSFSHNHIKIIDNINTSKVNEFCVIRNWIYRLLREDMEKIFKENSD